VGEREPELLFLIAFLASFGFIRTSAHMIRAQVSWWPGNVQVGGTHVHHLVWGICLLLISGYVGAVIRPDEPWSQIAIVGLGIGAGLTFDEFALWLNLRDVYWEAEGRRSIDAVIVVAAVAGLAATGFTAWIDAAEEVESEVFAAIGAIGAVAIACALVNAAKEKFGMAVLSLVVPVVGIVGAVRLGRPTSLWAHHLYGEAKRERAAHRFA
jgi:lysyl-tRNA synthetase class 2